MLTNAEREALAKELLTKTITVIEGWDGSVFHSTKMDKDGTTNPIYAGTSTEGFGSFICHFIPLETIQLIIQECEHIFDAFTIDVTVVESNVPAKQFVVSEQMPDNRQMCVAYMADGAVLHLLGSFRSQLAEMIKDTVDDCLLIAKVLLAAALARQFEGNDFGVVTADARADIETAAGRAAAMKRESLRESIRKLPHIVAERGRGAPAKTPLKRERERKDYALKVEVAYRELRLTGGKKPTKTSVAKALGEGGLNPKTGTDSSLAAFRNKLDRHGINYDLIVQKVETELNSNS